MPSAASPARTNSVGLCSAILCSVDNALGNYFVYNLRLAFVVKLFARRVEREAHSLRGVVVKDRAGLSNEGQDRTQGYPPTVLRTYKYCTIDQLILSMG